MRWKYSGWQTSKFNSMWCQIQSCALRFPFPFSFCIYFYFSVSRDLLSMFVFCLIICTMSTNKISITKKERLINILLWIIVLRRVSRRLILRQAAMAEDCKLSADMVLRTVQTTFYQPKFFQHLTTSRASLWLSLRCNGDLVSLMLHWTNLVTEEDSS